MPLSYIKPKLVLPCFALSENLGLPRVEFCTEWIRNMQGTGVDWDMTVNIFLIRLIKSICTLASQINVGQGINVGPGKFGKKKINIGP